ASALLGRALDAVVALLVEVPADRGAVEVAGIAGAIELVVGLVLRQDPAAALLPQPALLVLDPELALADRLALLVVDLTPAGHRVPARRRRVRDGIGLAGVP